MIVRIIGLRRRIYFSSIRVLHIVLRGGQGGKRKRSPGILHRVRGTLPSRVLWSCDENRFTPRTMMSCPIVSKSYCVRKRQVLLRFHGTKLSPFGHLPLDDRLKKSQEFLSPSTRNANRHCGLRCDDRRDDSNF